MDCRWLLDRLIEHEHLMARLYRAMAVRFPAKRALLDGLAREEGMHASLLSSIREFFPADVVKEADIEITLAQLEEQVGAIEGVMASLKNDGLNEKDIIGKVLDLELTGAELQINRIVLGYRNDPYLKLYGEILDGEEAHNSVLEDWRNEVT